MQRSGNSGIIPLDLTRRILSLVVPDSSSDMVNQDTENIHTITYSVKGFAGASLTVAYKCGKVFRVKISSISDRSNYICETNDEINKQLETFSDKVISEIIKRIKDKLCQ